MEGDRLRITTVRPRHHADPGPPGPTFLPIPVLLGPRQPALLAGPKRVTAPGIAFEDPPDIDLVLLSHNHYDHLDLVTLARLRLAHNPLVITPLGNDAIIKSHVPTMRVMTGDWGQSIKSGPATVHFEPCHHWSARGVNDRSMALWAAFVLETPGGKILHIGDTGFDNGRPYRNARERHGKLPRRDPARRRLRAALVHEGPASEPGRSHRGFCAVGRRTRAWPSLGHVPAHRRGPRRARRGAAGQASPRKAFPGTASGRCMSAKPGNIR